MSTKNFTIGAPARALELHHDVALVGEEIRFTSGHAAAAIEVAAAPPGSKAPAGSTFRPDVCGRYTLHVLEGGRVAAHLDLLVFPLEALEHPAFAYFQRGAHAAKYGIDLHGKTTIQGEHRPDRDRRAMLSSIGKDPDLRAVLASRLADKSSVPELFASLNLAPFGSSTI